jgi:hypothetical protein
MLSGVRSISPLVRAIFVIGAVAALVTSITFAALSDDATLASNNLSSDTADLQISNGGAYGDNVAGFNASNVVPGVGEEFSFYLSNASDFDMDVTVAVSGVCADYVNGADGITDCGDVKLTFMDTNTTTSTTYTLQQLINAPKDLPGNSLVAGSAGTAPADGTEGDFTVTFDLDPSGVSGSSASLTAPFDLVFTGTQVI